MNRVAFRKGQVVFNQGDRSDLCYKVIHGAVEIRVASYDTKGEVRNVLVERLGPGGVFGEMGIIDDAPRSASAVATEDTSCTAYTATEIMTMLETDPKEALAYIRTLLHRLRSKNVRVLVDGG